MQITFLTNLRNRLAALPKGELVLNAKSLGTEAFSSDWKDFLKVSEIRLLSAQVSAQVKSGNFTVNGTANLLGFLKIKVSVEFFLYKEGAASPKPGCLITAPKQTAVFNLVRFYGKLPGYLDISTPKLVNSPSFLQQIDFHDFQFAFSTVDFFPRPPEQPKLTTTFGAAPTLNARPLRAGINFLSTITTDAPCFLRLHSLAPTLKNLVVTGTASRVAGILGLELFCDLPNAKLDLAPKGAFTLALERLTIKSGLTADGESPSLTVHCSAGTPDFKLQLELDIVQGSPQLLATARFGDHVIEGAGDPSAQLLTVDKLASVLGLDHFASVFSGPLAKLGRVGLRELQAVVDFTKPTKPVATALNFTLACEKPLDLIPGVIGLSPIALFRIQNPFDKAKRKTSVELAGTARLGATDFQFSVDPASGNYQAQMAVGQSFDAAAILEKLLPGNIDLPQVELLDADIEGNYLQKTYRFSLEAGSDWSFPVGGKEIAVRNIQLEVEHKGQGTQAIVRGVFDAAGWEIDVAVDTRPPMEIAVVVPETNLSDLVEEFLSLILLPVDLPDFVLKDLNLKVRPKTKEFSISGASDTTFSPLHDVTFGIPYFEAQRDAQGMLTCLLTLSLKLGSVALELSARRQGASIGHEGWVFAGATAPGVTISGGDLIRNAAALVGTDLPDMPDVFEMRDLQVEYDSGAKTWSSTGAVHFSFALPWSGDSLDFEAQLAVRSVVDPATAKKSLVARVSTVTKIGSLSVALDGEIGAQSIWQGLITDLSLDAIVEAFLGKLSLSVDLPTMAFPQVQFTFQRGAGKPFFVEAASSLGWNLFDLLQIENVRFRAQRIADGAVVDKAVLGNLTIAGVTATLQADLGARLILSGTFSRLALGAFLESLFAPLLDEAGPAGAILRQALNFLNLSDAVLSFSGSGGGAFPEIRLSGQPSGLPFRVELGAVRNASKWSLLVGIVPGEHFRFTDILGSGAGFLDAVLPNKQRLFLGLAPQPVQAGAGPSLPSLPPTYSGGAGVSMVAELPLAGTGIDQFLGIDSIPVSATFTSPTAVILSATLLADHGDNGDVFQFRGLSLFVRVAAVPSFGISGRLVLKIDEPALDFTVSCEVAPGAFYLTAQLAQWDTPFGIPGIYLWDLALRVGGNSAGVPSLGLAAHARLGDFRGGAAFNFDSGNPSRCMAALDFQELSLAVLLSSFFGDRVPSEVSKLYPLSLQDVDVEVVPPGAAFGGYQEGIRLKGTAVLDLVFAKLKGSLDGEVNLSQGVRLKGSLDKLSLGPLFEISSASGDGGPFFELNLDLLHLNPYLILSGSVKTFGITLRESLVKVSRDGIFLQFAQHWGPAEYDVALTVTNFEHPEALSLVLTGSFLLAFDVDVPALTIPNPLPIGGDIPVWPSFHLSTDVHGEIELEAGRVSGLALRNMRFEWGGSGFSIPDMNLRIQVDDLQDLPGLLKDFFLDNVETIFEELINEIKDKLTAGFREIAKIAEEAAAYAQQAAGYVAEGAKFLADAQTWKNAAAAAEQAWNTVSGEISNVAQQTAGYLAEGARFFADAKVWSDAAAAAEQAWSEVSSQVSRLGNQTAGYVSEGAKFLTDAQTWRSAAGLAEQGWNIVSGQIAGVANQTAGYVSEAAGFLTSAQTWNQAADAALQAANAIADETRQVLNQAENLANSAVDLAQNTFNDMKDKVSQLASQAQDVANRSLDILRDIGRAIVDNLNPSNW